MVFLDTDNSEYRGMLVKEAKLSIAKIRKQVGMWDGGYQIQLGKLLLPFLVCFLVSYQYQYVNGKHIRGVYTLLSAYHIINSIYQF